MVSLPPLPPPPLPCSVQKKPQSRVVAYYIIKHLERWRERVIRTVMNEAKLPKIGTNSNSNSSKVNMWIGKGGWVGGMVQSC